MTIVFEQVGNVRNRRTRIHQSSQPGRRGGAMSLFAASELGTFRLARSHESFWPVWDATLPSKSVSVTMAENSKLPPGFSLLPLQALSHSRSLPGERGRVFGGG